MARFSLAANPSGARAFVGLSALFTNICAVEPSSVANTIGMGFDSTDSNTGNWYFIRKDGSTLQKIALDGTAGSGAGAAPRNATDVYDLLIHADANASDLLVRILNVTTGAVLYNGQVSTFLPTNTSFLYVHAQAGRGGRARRHSSSCLRSISVEPLSRIPVSGSHRKGFSNTRPSLLLAPLAWST